MISTARQTEQVDNALGMALTAHPGDGSTVTVPGNVLAWTKDTLIVFRDNLAQQRWSSCPCGQDCGQHVTDAAVLRAVRDDLQLLPDTISA